MMTVQVLLTQLQHKKNKEWQLKCHSIFIIYKSYKVKNILILILVAFALNSKAQNSYPLSVTKENGVSVSTYTNYINIGKISYIVYKTSPDIWTEDISWNKVIKYNTATETDSLYKQINRLKGVLVRVLKTEKAPSSTRDTTIKYLLGLDNIISYKAKTSIQFPQATTSVRLRVGTQASEIFILETAAALKARIDSVRTANP